MLKVHSFSLKEKKEVIIDVMLTYSRIKFFGVPLFIFYVVVCVETSSIEVFNPKDQVPLPCTDVSQV
jgi:hypothetical protein